MAYGNALGEAGLEREAVACFLALQEMDRTDPLGARFETLKYVRDPETGEPLPPFGLEARACTWGGDLSLCSRSPPSTCRLPPVGRCLDSRLSASETASTALSIRNRLILDRNRVRKSHQ